MSNAKARTDNLFRKLTAHERAMIVLRTLREGRKVDPQVYDRMPENQWRAFNRLRSQFGTLNGILMPYVLNLLGMAEQLELRLLLLALARTWGEERHTVRMLISATWPEPMSLAVFEAAREQSRAEDLSVEEAVEMMVNRSPSPPDEDWDARYGEALDRLDVAVESGAVGRGQQEDTVNTGAFHDWLGVPTPVIGDWGEAIGYPDAMDPAHIEQQAELRQLLLDLLVSVSPEQQALGMVGRSAPRGDAPGAALPSLDEGLVTGLQGCWEGLESARIVADEVAEEFEGEDPLLLDLREWLEEGREIVQRVAQGLQVLNIAFELEEPSSEALALLRDTVNETARRRA